MHLRNSLHLAPACMNTVSQTVYVAGRRRTTAGQAVEGLHAPGHSQKNAAPYTICFSCSGSELQLTCGSCHIDWGEQQRLAKLYEAFRRPGQLPYTQFVSVAVAVNCS